jgi:predicted transcriptional regulator
VDAIKVESAIQRKTDPRGKFRNRSRMEIIAVLLNIAKAGTLKTHLMYGANLSYLMVTEYLNILLDAELIREEVSDDGSKQFKTTEKGFKCLEIYDTLKGMIGAQYLAGD